MKYKKILAMVLSAVIVANSTMPALATESTQEVIVAYEDEVENETYETSTVANGDIASGFIENDKGGVSWSIDDTGHLLIEGKGEYNVDGEIPWRVYYEEIKSAKIVLTDITDMSKMFYGCKSVTTIDMSGCDTSNVTDMSEMFYWCESVTTINMSGCDTSNVTDMSKMFYECGSLTQIDISGFDTSKVKNMSLMFYSCRKLKNLDLNGFDTSNVTNMSGMFVLCRALDKLDVSGFNTSNTTDMSEMFRACMSLESLDLSGFDTSQVTNMSGMFCDCELLNNLNIKRLDTSSVTDVAYMFSGCSSLSEINLSGFDLSGITAGHSMLGYCDALQKIQTPLNVPTTIKIQLNGEWFSSDGTQWVNLPEELGYSILLEKGKIPSDNPETGDDQEITFMEIDGGEIFGKGSAHVRTLLKDNKSQILANTAVYYSFSENFEDQQLVTSDENGYITIKTPELSNTRSETEVHALTAYLKLHEGDDKEILNYALKMKVNVYPLSYSQSWELGVGGTLGAALGPGAGVGIGAADVKVQLAGLKGELGVTGTLSVENSYENGKRTLSLSQNYGAGVSGSAEIGPAATVGVLGTDLALKPVVVSGNAETNTLGGIGLKIDNYDPLNEEQVRSIGEFLLSYLATARGNLFLLCALGADYFNQFSTTENLGAGVGAGIASVEYEGNSLGETTNLEAGALRSYSINYDLGENSQEKVFELTREFDAKPGALIGDQLFSEGVDSSMKVETTHTDGNLDNLVVGRTISTEKNSLFIREEVASKSIEVSYSSDDAAQIFQEIPKLESFSRGKTRYFFGKMPKTMLSSIDKSSATGEYTESEEKTTIYSKDFEISAQLGVGVEVGAEFEGVGKYSYETEKGTYSNGRRNVSYSASSDLGDLVVSQKIGIKELLTEPLETMASVIENDLRRVSAKIEEGVVIVDAYIRCKAEEAKEWVVHMIALNKDKLSRTTVQSYSIATVSFEEEDAPGVALTVGDPYIVYVTDEDGEEVTDYSECPLELTLSYTPEMLQAAKATASDAKNLGIYMHVDEKAGYVYVGGTVDEANQQVTVEITKPGQYILAIDTLAPGITDFNVSDSSSTPTINVSFDENSAFSDFSMELDGKEIVNAENWEEYYNGSLRRISYSVETELSDGEHEVSVYAVDSAGNAMKQAAVFTFTVDTELPELSKLTVSVDEDVLRVRAWSDHMDITNAYAKVQWKDADENIITEEYMMDVMDGYYTVMCEPEEDALFATVSVITTDANGNRCESEEIIKNLENPELNSSNDLWIRFVDGSGETRSEYEYIGKAIKPVVQIYEGTELLKEKTDYTLSFKNNTNAGTATITVKAKGNYQGQDTENFTILPKDIAEENVIAGNISCVANGKTQLKVPTIKFGKLTLSNKKNKDFSVTWPDTAEGAYKDVGTYVIKVTGNGNYTGERDIQLLIGGKTVNKLSVSKISTQTYTGTAIEIPNLVVKDGKKELINGTDYMVSYKDNVKIGTAKLIITGIGGYYVGTKEISFKIQGISMSKVKVDATSLPKTVIYNGEEQTPELRLYYQKNKTAEIEYLVKDMHYKVTYHKNVNVGSAQIILEGMGKYSGTMKKSFKIAPFDAKKNENGRIVIELDDTFVYAKGGVKPETVVKFGDKILTLGKDYTLAYANNKAVTTEKTKKLPTVTIKFKGNYKGSCAEIFEIIGQSLEELTIFVKDKVYSTKKNAWKSAPVIKDLDGKVLKLGTDYEKLVSYYTDADCTAEVGNEILEAGTYIWVKAEGKGNYAGSCIVGRYRITTSSITKANVKIEKQYYTGKAIEPNYDDITSVVVNKQELTAGKDYEIVENSYQKNVKAGTATMQIKGIGNYGDVLTVKYSIQKKNFIWRWFEGLF